MLQQLYVASPSSIFRFIYLHFHLLILPIFYLDSRNSSTTSKAYSGQKANTLKKKTMEDVAKRLKFIQKLVELFSCEGIQLIYR